jgi:Tol biopolymer transport system component
MIGVPELQENPILSPDDRRLAVSIKEGQNDLWVYDLDRGIKTRYTFDPAQDMPTSWTPSGKQLIFFSMRSGNPDIYSTAASGEATLLVGTPAPEVAAQWSPDEKHLLYSVGSAQNANDLVYRERGPDGKLGEPALFVKGSHNALNGRFSPDGSLVAYMSDESGGYEIYVRDFPHGTHKWQVSTNGGMWPRWRHDGKELFFIEQHSRALMSLAVITQPSFSPGVPAVVFEKSVFSNRGLAYDVASDGKRFVVLERPEGPPVKIHVSENWFEEFRTQHAQAK